MGNTASTLQTPDGGAGGPRSRSPSVRRSIARAHGGGETLSASTSLSLAASSALQQQEKLAAAVAAAAAAATPAPAPASASASATGGARTAHRSRTSTHDSQQRSPQHFFVPLPTLSHPHPQSHVYAFANQASLEPILSAVHSHPFSSPTSPGPDDYERVTTTSRSRPGSAGAGASSADVERLAGAATPRSRSRSVKTSSSSQRNRAESPSTKFDTDPIGEERSGQDIVPVKDALGRTLTAALPSYLRIPTTSMGDDENTLEYYNIPTADGGSQDLGSGGDTVDPSSGAAGQGSQRKRTSLMAKPSGATNSAVPFMAILLTWRGGGHNVSVTGTFANEWRSRIPLSRVETGSRKERGNFSCLLHLPPGTHRLKFLVDDRWKVSPDLSTATDGEGNLVNYVEIPNVGPDHSGPLSAPGEDLPEDGDGDGGKTEDEAERTRGDDDIRFPPAYLRASRLGKFGLVKIADAEGGGQPTYGLQSPAGGQEQELVEPSSQHPAHGKDSSDHTVADDPTAAFLDGIVHSSHPPNDERAAAATRPGPTPGDDKRTSYYAESTTSSSGTAGPGNQQHNDLKITPMYARFDLDDDRPRASLDDVFGDDLKSKAEADSWTHEIPEVIIQAQIAEEREHERLEAYAKQGKHDHEHHSSLPGPPSLPRQLEKVILNSGPAGLEGAVDDNSVLPAPNHVVLSHLTASSIRKGVLAVGTTTRYKRKYVTTVFHRPVK